MRARSSVLRFAAAALLVPSSACAQEAPTRPEKHESDASPPSIVRVYTLVGGVGFTAAWWGLGAGTSYIFPDQSGIHRLRTPVIGPWRALGTESCNGSCDASFYISTIWYALDGIAQAAGLGIALESVLLPTSDVREASPRPSPSPTSDEPSPADAPKPEGPPPAKPLFFLPQPIRIGQSGFGIGMAGLF